MHALQRSCEGTWQLSRLEPINRSSTEASTQPVQSFANLALQGCGVQVVRRVFTFSCGMLPRFHYAEGLCQPQVLKASDTTKTRRAQVIDAQTTRLQVLVRTSSGGVVDRTGADLRGQLPSFERSQIAAAQDPARYSPTNCQRSLCRSKGSRLSAALQVDWERGGVGVDRAPGT